MQRIRVVDAARFGEGKMEKVPLFESPRFFCDLYCLRPGQAQNVHAHAGADKVYYCISGQAMVQVGEETAELMAGEAVLAPAGATHGVSNRTDEPLALLVFMAPRPDGKS